MNMTHSDIAREAAEKLHEYFEHVRSDVLAAPDSDVTAALILSAAAKMVGESGLEGLPDELLAKRTEIANRAGPYMSTGTDGYCDGLSYSARILKERLSALRALTEHKGEGR